MIERPIERVRAPSRAEFRREWQSRRVPVVLTGCLDGWPALTQWSPADLGRRFGDRVLPVIPTRDGMPTYSPREGVPYGRMRVADFVDDVAADGRGNYMVFRVEEELPELLGDVGALPYTADAPWRRSRFWFAPRDVGGVLHHDLPENLYAQISGRKRWTLFDRRDWPRMYPHPPWSGTPNYSRADGERPDLARFPRMADATRWSTVLAPGELLYIPSFWWHQARSVDVSVSINFWWAEGLTRALARAAEVFMRVRGLRL